MSNENKDEKKAVVDPLHPAVDAPMVIDYRHRLPLLSGQTIRFAWNQTGAGNDE